MDKISTQHREAGAAKRPAEKANEEGRQHYQHDRLIKKKKREQKQQHGHYQREGETTGPTTRSN
jgi:hypothetical protein